MNKPNNTKTSSVKGWCLWMREFIGWAFGGLTGAILYALPTIGCGVLPMVAAYVVILMPPVFFECNEVEVRWFGGLLQLLGLVVVSLKLFVRLRLFDKLALISRVRQFWQRFPSRNTGNARLSGHGSTSFLTAKARLSAKPGPNASLGVRIRVVESAIKDIKKDVHDLKKTQSQHEKEIRDSLDVVRQDTSRQVEGLNNLMGKAVVGNVGSELFGISCILSGIVVVTIAPEIPIWSVRGVQCDLG